ncbi:MAG TPA: helix-turn-helix domain-containing protein [Acidimicrobiales bacterium]|nr:helix-turn-helix domain-containing protein [Acidimicrobiales bacterium]
MRAALDLFTEQGYDFTTVAQIAERAGLTKSTFFRHFPDKREVLVAGQDTLCRLFADAIAAAPATATPLEAVAAALDAAAEAFTPERRDLGPKVQAVIAASSELQERDALKRVGLATAITEALQKRGVPDPTASLAAELGVLALKIAHARWSDPANQGELGELARQSLHELQAASAALS